jgi:hypothetical protein
MRADPYAAGGGQGEAGMAAVVAVVEALSVGTIEGAAWMMMVRVIEMPMLRGSNLDPRSRIDICDTVRLEIK